MRKFRFDGNVAWGYMRGRKPEKGKKKTRLWALDELRSRIEETKTHVRPTTVTTARWALSNQRWNTCSDAPPATTRQRKNRREKCRTATLLPPRGLPCVCIISQRHRSTTRPLATSSSTYYHSADHSFRRTFSRTRKISFRSTLCFMASNDDDLYGKHA